MLTCFGNWYCKSQDPKGGKVKVKEKHNYERKMIRRDAGAVTVAKAAQVNCWLHLRFLPATYTATGRKRKQMKNLAYKGKKLPERDE